MSIPVQPSSIEPSRRLRLWISGTLFLCFVYFLPRLGDFNQDSRLDTTVAIVNHGTTVVDQYRWNAGIDVTFRDGHYYANKAPGQALAAIPVALAYKELLTATGHRVDAGRIGVKRYRKKLFFNFVILQMLESIATVAIPAILFYKLFLWFLGFFTVSVVSRVALTLATALGTIMFPYSTVFYPHVPTAALLFTAFALLYIAGAAVARQRAPRLAARLGWTAALAGLCLGGAVIFDHTCALPGGIIALYGLTRLPRRTWPLFALGAVPALLITIGYDYVSYHNAAVTGYNAKGGGGVASTDAGVVGRPSWQSLWGMSFSPYRGIFFLSPFLLLAFPGAWLWRRRGGMEWLWCLAVPGAYFLAISAIAFWYGGSSVGPRYLVPVMPFLALPVVFVLDAVQHRLARFLVYGLMVLSGIVVWLETAAERPFPRMEWVNPLFDHALPALIHGHVALSIGGIVLARATGLYSTWTLLPLAILMALWTAWNAFQSRRGRERVRAMPEAGTSNVVAR